MLVWTAKPEEVVIEESRKYCIILTTFGIVKITLELQELVLFLDSHQC